MPKFVSNLDLMHAFANRLYEEGRYSRLFFKGNKIYSYGYHYLLGEINEAKGIEYIYINDEAPSKTTKEHVRLLISASTHYKQFFESTCNDEIALERLRELFTKLRRAKKPEYYMAEIRYICKQNIEWCELTDKEVNEEIKAFYDVINSNENLRNLTDAVAKELEEKEREKLQRMYEENKAKFLNYESDAFIIPEAKYSNYKPFALLRLSKDGKYIETSKGIRMEIGRAIKYYEKLINKELKVNDMFDRYKIRDISKNAITINCHYLSLEDMSNLYQKIKSYETNQK